MYEKEGLQKADTNALISIILSQQEQIAELNTNVSNLMEMIAVMNQRRFGRSSEKSSDSVSGQLSLNFEGENGPVFNEVEAVSDPDVPEETLDQAVPVRHKKAKGKRKEDLSGLPVEIEEHYLTEEQLLERLGPGWKRLPDEIYSRVKFQPASVSVIEHHTGVYASKDGSRMVKGKRPSDLLTNSIATPSLVAAVMNGKYFNALPLYRIAREMENSGIHISRQTMANWTILCSEKYLNLLYDRFFDELLNSHVLHGDETPCLVNKDGRPAGSKSYMWVYRTGKDYLHPVVLYNYQKTRKQDHPREFLKDFKGVLVTDGYQVYHGIDRDNEDVHVAGCWSHARRKFAEMVKTLGSAGNGSIAAEALKKIQEMYRLDNSYAGLSPDERKQKRQETLKPLVDSFFNWLTVQKSAVPSQSQTGKGITYCLNQEKYLRYFLEDGEVPMDNNAAERAIRGFCIGKKNWVMIDTVKGAEASAVIYSIIETAKANHLRSYHYLEYILTQLAEHQEDKNLAFIEDILPWSEKLPDECRFK